jgi:hypothetical protein
MLLAACMILRNTDPLYRKQLLLAVNTASSPYAVVQIFYLP